MTIKRIIDNQLKLPGMIEIGGSYYPETMYMPINGHIAAEGIEPHHRTTYTFPGDFIPDWSLRGCLNKLKP